MEETSNNYSLDTMAVQDWLETRENGSIETWFDKRLAEIAEDDAWEEYTIIANSLYEAAKNYYEVFPYEEEEVAKAVAQGLIFSLYVCLHHEYYMRDGGLEGPDEKLFDSALGVATENMYKKIEELYSEAESPHQWYSSIMSTVDSSQPEGLDAIVNDYKYNLCPEISNQHYFEFGAKVGGYISNIATNAYQMGRHIVKARSLLEGEITVEDFMTE